MMKAYPIMTMVSSKNPIAKKKQNTILLVEDDYYIRELFKELLVSAGIRVIDLPDPRNQIEVMKKEKENIDLVFSGIMMPYKTGIDSLKEIKQIDGIKHIPWAICSNLGQIEIIAEASRVGAKYFMLKSEYTPDQLIKEVTAILNNDTSKIQSDISTVLTQMKYKTKYREEYLRDIQSRISFISEKPSLKYLLIAGVTSLLSVLVLAMIFENTDGQILVSFSLFITVVIICVYEAGKYIGKKQITDLLN